MTYGIYFLISILLTITVEIPVLFFSIKYIIKIKRQKKEIFYWGVFVNLFSLPYLWFVFPLFIKSNLYILIGEILVVIIESFIYLKVLKTNFKNAFILSLIANTMSYLAGNVMLEFFKKL